MARMVLFTLLAGALACGVLVLVHAGEEVYAVPGWAVVATVVLMLASIAGAVLIERSGGASFGVLLLAGVALAVFGVLAILSIGLLALIAGAVVLTLALRRPERPAAAAAGAVLAGVALPVLLVFALAGRVVDCDEEGARSGENVFLGLTSDEAEGEATSSPDGVETGSARGEGYEYRYTCRDGELVEFELRRR